MKTIKIFAIAAAVAALAACTKQQAIETGTSFKKGQEVTLNVTADASATKVSSELNGTAVDFKWQAGDKILVTVGTETAEFTLASGAGEASATFTGTMPADGSTFDVQYPVTDPVLTTQTYSSTEAIPHNMMKFAQTGCTTSSPTFSLTPQDAALRLNLWGTSQTISKIVVTNTTSSATYTLTISGGVTLPTTEAAAQAFFIVVPAGDWNFSAEVFDNAATPASICSFSPSAAQTFEANKILNMPAKEVAVAAPSPVLSGDFKINSSGTTVKFSRGNLYYDGSTSTWGFESNQYDYRTYAGANSCIGGTVSDTGTPANNWGSFGWVGASSTTLTGDLTKYGMSTSKTTSDYGTSTSDALYADWADISTLPQVSGRKWKTLTGGSSGEWYYLLNTRSGVTIGSTTGCRYAEVKVNSICGMLIFPDTFTWPSDVDISRQPSTFNTYQSSWNSVDYSVAEFTSLQNAGCVFLPAAGYRYGSVLDGVGSLGFYWSSTPNGTDDAYSLLFLSGNVSPANLDYRRCRGYSVRLVSAAQ